MVRIFAVWFDGEPTDFDDGTHPTTILGPGRRISSPPIERETLQSHLTYTSSKCIVPAVGRNYASDTAIHPGRTSTAR